MNDLTVQQNNLPAISTESLVGITDDLQRDLGSQAGSSVALVNDLLGMAPDEVAKDLLASGIFNKPHVVRWVAAMLQAEAALANDGVNVESEIAQIERVMRTDRRRYNQDEAMQARYRVLLATR